MYRSRRAFMSGQAMRGDSGDMSRRLAAIIRACLKHRTNHRHPSHKIRADVDREVVDLVAKMLSRDPPQRSTSADEVASSLQSFASDSRLKALVREALRRPNTEAQSSSRLPSVSQGRQPPNRRLGRWLAGAFFASTLIFTFLTTLSLCLMTTVRPSCSL